MKAYAMVRAALTFVALCLSLPLTGTAGVWAGRGCGRRWWRRNLSTSESRDQEKHAEADDPGD